MNLITLREKIDNDLRNEKWFQPKWVITDFEGKEISWPTDVAIGANGLLRIGIACYPPSEWEWITKETADGCNKAVGILLKFTGERLVQRI